ncbi:MAG: hypothetical protein ACPGJS_07185 [Flammeovirgaceae bacterium]
MREEDKQFLERVNAYCSYGVLVVTICFCALIYWGNQQLNLGTIPPKVENHEVYDNGSDHVIVKATTSSTTNQH